MSEEKDNWILATGALVIIIGLVGIVPGTLFTAYACKTIWNTFARDIYPQITTLHAIGPMLVCSLAMFKSVDCVKPDRTSGEAVWNMVAVVIRPYVLGGWFLLCAWILSCFV
jgi:hypothetical protein